MLKCLLIFGFLFLSLPSFAAEKFLIEGEQIRAKQIGDLTVLVLEDFIGESIEPATILAYEQFDKPMFLVERGGQMALLLPEKLFNDPYVGMFVTFAAKSCQDQCGGTAAGVVIGGGLGIIGGYMGAYEQCRISTKCDVEQSTGSK